MVVSPAVAPVETNASAPPPRRPPAGGDWAQAVRDAAPYLGIGSSLALMVLLCLGAGYWVDRKLATAPWFFLLGGMFGLFAAAYHFIKSVKGLDK